MTPPLPTPEELARRYEPSDLRDMEAMVRHTLARVRAEQAAEWPIFRGAWKAWAAGLAGLIGTALVEWLPQVIAALASGQPLDLEVLGTLGRGLAVAVLTGLAAYLKKQGEPGKAVPAPGAPQP